MAKIWMDQTISFEYKNRKYTEKIRGTLVLNDLSMDEVMDRLNEIPGKFAYWKSLQVHVELELEKKKEEFDAWMAGRYQAASDAFEKKPTETAIQNRIILDNADDYRKRKLVIHNLDQIVKKIGVITKAFDYQVWTLGRIAGLVAQEMDSIQPRAVGRGNLKDI